MDWEARAARVEEMEVTVEEAEEAVTEEADGSESHTTTQHLSRPLTPPREDSPK